MTDILFNLQEKYQKRVELISAFLFLVYLGLYPAIGTSTEIYGIFITIPVIFLSLLGKRMALFASISGMMTNSLLEIFVRNLSMIEVIQWFIPKIMVIFLAFIIGSYADLNAANSKLLKEVKQNLDEIKKLRELLPICSYCKNIRNNRGYWEDVDEYLQSSKIATFTHGVCESCLENIQKHMEKK